MEIRIISSEIIKPSSPTPPHLKTHNLSLIDQLNLNIYFGYPLFYNRGDKSVVEISDHLKRSLSKTLTHYYPFAGRVRDDSFVDCDDSGVPFIEAYVDINMFEVLRKLEMNILEQLLPYNPNKKVSTDDHPNLAVQINYFDCGGFAVCACFRHVIADASAAALFLKNWAAVARGFSDIKDVVFDCSSIFPPNELAKNVTKNTIERQRSIDCVSKRFTFDGTKIASLIKEIANRFKHRRRPTRFEVVSALIWGALISMAKESGDASPFILTPLNVRKRMNPPFPEECIGNVIFCVTGNWLDNEAVDYSSLANKIHQLVKMLSEDEVRKYYDSLGDQLSKGSEDFKNDSTQVSMICITSLSGLPFYEVDFGWGKPTWVSVCMKFINVVILLDTSDGKGIEALVALSKKDMEKFEQDPAILTYSSLDPIVSFQSKL